jgi:RNA polymerase sigma factor (sigma-70 family)
VIAMRHHAVDDYVRTVQSDRFAAVARRRPAVDGSDLERLVATAAAGDRSAWDGLVTRFAPQLLRVARSLGLSRHDAEDAVQDTWIRLLSNIERIREPHAIGGWLTTTARRESLNVRRRSAREAPTDEELGSSAATAPDEAEAALHRAECRDAVAHALGALPAHHQRLMHALFAETAGSYHQIAAQLEMPIGSIGPIRGRCLAQLRRDEQLRQAAELID